MPNRLRYRHPKTGELYTPVTDVLLEQMRRMKVEHYSWRRVSELSGVRLRVLRGIHRKQRSAISQTLWDRLVTSTGVGDLDSHTWFQPEDLVALGIWKPTMHVEGKWRIQGDVTTEGRSLDEQRRRRKEFRKEKLIRQQPPEVNELGFKRSPWL